MIPYNMVETQLARRWLSNSSGGPLAYLGTTPTYTPKPPSRQLHMMLLYLASRLSPLQIQRAASCHLTAPTSQDIGRGRRFLQAATPSIGRQRGSPSFNNGLGGEHAIFGVYTPLPPLEHVDDDLRLAIREFPSSCGGGQRESGNQLAAHSWF